MNPEPTNSPGARSLDQHGAASRCLLRLRENSGQPVMTDAEFLQRFAPLFPAWHERPGVLDAHDVGQLVRELGLGEGVTLRQDYDDVLRAHRAGRSVLIATERAPIAEPQAERSRPHVVLLEAMDEDAFTIWCPFPSGASDVLPAVARAWWSDWRAAGIVLTPNRSS